jgi:hypothetical protein
MIANRTLTLCVVIVMLCDEAVAGFRCTPETCPARNAAEASDAPTIVTPYAGPVAGLWDGCLHGFFFPIRGFFWLFHNFMWVIVGKPWQSHEVGDGWSYLPIFANIDDYGFRGL